MTERIYLEAAILSLAHNLFSNFGLDPEIYPMAGSVAVKKQENLLTEEQQSILKQTTADIDRLQQDITTLVNPLLKATDSWSKHVTPSTLSVFQEDGHWERISEKAEANLLKRTYKSPDATSWSAMMGSLGDDESDTVSDEPFHPL